MGGTGFPTLMFLNSDGAPILTHSGPRTVSAFDDSLENVDAFRALMAKAAAGDARAATTVLIQQLQLGWFDLEEAQARVAKLTKVNPRQEKILDQLLIETEVRSIAEAAQNNRKKRQEAGKHFHAMWEAKRIPVSEGQLFSFWMMIADYAEHEYDEKLFKSAVDGFRRSLDGNRYRRYLEALEARLKKL